MLLNVFKKCEKSLRKLLDFLIIVPNIIGIAVF